MRKARGFSLVELLVVVAIISILMAMYASTFIKVREKAKQVVAKEGMRQSNIGRMADDVNSARPSRRATPESSQIRQQARSAYREDVGDGVMITRPLYLVQNDAEFRAYWHTLLNPANTTTVEFDGGNLRAHDGAGGSFVLPPVDGHLDSVRAGNSDAVIAWEYFSTHLGDANTSSIGANVLHVDGNIAYIRYPGRFPITQTVAELSHRFMLDFH
jgi:prepilin-type N-terminal cleavage/methylation domain-containing protein